MGQNVGGSLGSSSRPSSNRKVATWASLFQTEDENFGLERSKMGQYSCSRLLREMEAVESEAEDEIASMTVVDVEMMTLHATLCAKLTKNKCDTYLLDDIYSIPGMMDTTQNQQQEVVSNEKKKKSTCGTKTQQRSERWNDSDGEGSR
jgi:hypothetical protein